MADLKEIVTNVLRKHGQYMLDAEKAEAAEAVLAALREAGALAERDEMLAKVGEEKNGVYKERDMLVAALSKQFPSRLEGHSPDAPDYDPEWGWVVHIDLPTGQAGWHIHQSELPWFDHLERRDGSSWDGHSTEEKYARLARLEPRK